MNNIIKLDFEKSTTRLAGNPYGKQVYQQQVKDKINFEQKNTIIFPKNIEKVASSFVQGFFEEIIKEVGYARVKDVIDISSTHSNLVTSIYLDLI